MDHEVRILDRGQTVKHLFSDDIGDLSLTACITILNIQVTYLQVLVDGEYLNISVGDIGKIRMAMMEMMKSNERSCDFEIDGLFEI